MRVVTLWVWSCPAGSSSTVPAPGPAGPAPATGPVSKHKSKTGGGGSGPGMGVPMLAPAADGTAAPPEHSTTNVQEAGVDEPDIVKTDGLRLFAIADGKLRAVNLAHGSPRVAGSLALQGSGQQLLLHGDRVLVFSNSYANVAGSPVYTPSRSQTTLTEVDVSNPAAMRVTATMTIDGAYVSARLNGATCPCRDDRDASRAGISEHERSR